MGDDSFREFFKHATGIKEGPYPYQERLAAAAVESRLIDVPTGCGKTAAVILAWLWRRRYHRESAARASTPRRLVYCLPMRVLVEQTRKNTDAWLEKLGLQDEVGVHILMGGEEADGWDLYPEREAILLGTQDMLLSRALNRGYGMSRYRWPMHFGLLNNDCLWVMDEIQLMGPGLGTACQLEAFRCSATDGQRPVGVGSFFDSCSVTWYMSATASADLLATREWRSVQRPTDFVWTLSDTEKTQSDSPLGKRRFATKSLDIHPDWNFGQDQMQERIGEIISRHSDMLRALQSAPADLPRRSLVICNTVERAVAAHKALREEQQGGKLQHVDLVLLHSRFRPPDRTAQMDRLEPHRVDAYDGGQIVVATQVIEAGIDMSSAILWTEIAPLACLVQRFGRINRAGEFGLEGGAAHGWSPQAIVFGIDLPAIPPRETAKQREERGKEVARRYLPYDQRACESAWRALSLISGDASPAALDAEPFKEAISESIYRCPYSLQRHELLDFFDTDSNLSMGYTDVSPFIRGLDDDTDVYVLWREWEGDANDHFRWDVGRDEVCGVPIGRLRSFGSWREGWVWLGKDRGWVSTQLQRAFPGATLLLPTSAGGYAQDRGWTGNDKDKPGDFYQPPKGPDDEDLLSYLNHGWRSIRAHTEDVRSTLCGLLSRLPLSEDVKSSLMTAVDWHDIGKNHERWQEAAAKALADAEISWPSEHQPIAKFSLSDSPRLCGLAGRELRGEIYRLKRLFRPGIAHEVASALALRQWHVQTSGQMRSLKNQDAYLSQLLAEYLVMSHHGHVRKVLRDEIPRKVPLGGEDAETVRGIREGDRIAPVPMNGDSLGCEGLSVRCRQIGREANGQESYTRGVLRLLDHYGPFRLAYLESLFRAADGRASEVAASVSEK